jgi:hypothetical protein
MRRLLAATLVAAFAIAACSGTAAPTSTPSQPDSSQPPRTAIATAPPSTVAAAAPATPSAVPTVTAVKPADGVVFLDGGCTGTLARCQNMAAGTYETSGRFPFLPGLTLTLPAGWSSPEQDAGEFMLHQASDPDQANAIFFWSDLVPWVDGAARPELGTTANEFADYLLGDKRLAVVEGPSRMFSVREPASLAISGSVQARSLGVMVSPSAASDAELSDCPGGATCVNIFIDPDHWPRPANLNRNIDAPVAGCPCSQVWRLYVASIGSELDPHMFVVAIETVGPDPLEALSAWEAQVEPIIESVLLPQVVINN